MGQSTAPLDGGLRPGRPPLRKADQPLLETPTSPSALPRWPDYPVGARPDLTTTFSYSGRVPSLAPQSFLQWPGTRLLQSGSLPDRPHMAQVSRGLQSPERAPRQKGPRALPFVPEIRFPCIRGVRTLGRFEAHPRPLLPQSLPQTSLVPPSLG